MKVAKKPVAVQNERSMGTNLSQLNEKRKWAGKEKGGGGGVKPSLKIVIKEDK